MLHIACGICELQKKTNSRVRFAKGNSKEQGDCRCHSDDDVSSSSSPSSSSSSSASSEEEKLESNGELTNIRRRKGQVLDDSQELVRDKGDGFSNDSESGLKEALGPTSEARSRESSTKDPAAMEETSVNAEPENAAASAKVVGYIWKDVAPGAEPPFLNQEPAGSCSSSDSESPVEVKDKPQFDMALNSEEGRGDDGVRNQLTPKHHHDAHHNDSGISEHGTSDSNCSEDENGGPEDKPWEGAGCDSQGETGCNNKTAASLRQARRARDSKVEPAKNTEWKPEELDDDISFSTPDIGEDFYCTSSLSPFSNPISTAFCISGYNPMTNDSYSNCRVLEPEEGGNSRSSSRKTSLEERNRKVAEIVEPCGQSHITYQDWCSLSKNSDKAVVEVDFEESRTTNQSDTKKAYSSIDFEFNFEKFLREFGGQPEGTLETIYEDDLGCDEDSEMSEEVEDRYENKFHFDRQEGHRHPTSREMDVTDKSPREHQTATTIISPEIDAAQTEVLIKVRRSATEDAQLPSKADARESFARQENSSSACLPKRQQWETGKADPATVSGVPSSSSSSPSSPWPESARASPPKSNGMLSTDHIQYFSNPALGLPQSVFESLESKEARFLKTPGNPQEPHHRTLLAFEPFSVSPPSTSYSSSSFPKPDRSSSSYAHSPGPLKGVGKQGVEENAREIRNDGSAKWEQTESRVHEEGVGSRPVGKLKEEREEDKKVEEGGEPVLPMRNRRKEKDIRGATRLDTSVSFENTSAPRGLGNEPAMFNQQETEPAVGSGVPAAPPATGPVRPPAATATTPTASKLINSPRSSTAPGGYEGRADAPRSFNENQTNFNENSSDVDTNMNSTAPRAAHDLNPKDNDVTSAKPAGLVVAAQAASSALLSPPVPQSQQPSTDHAADGSYIYENNSLPHHKPTPGPDNLQASRQGSSPLPPPPTRPARSKSLTSRRAHRPQTRSSEANATSPVSVMALASSTPSASADSWEVEEELRRASEFLRGFRENLCDRAKLSADGNKETSNGENGSCQPEKKLRDNDLKSQDDILELQDDSGTLCGFVVKSCISEKDPCNSAVEPYDSLEKPYSGEVEQSFNKDKACCDAAEPCSCAVVIHAGDHVKQLLENLEIPPSSEVEKGEPWDSPSAGRILFFPFSADRSPQNADSSSLSVEPPLLPFTKSSPSPFGAEIQSPVADSDSVELLPISGEPTPLAVEPKPPGTELRPPLHTELILNSTQPQRSEPLSPGTEPEPVGNKPQSSISATQPSITDYEALSSEAKSRITKPQLLNTELKSSDPQPSTHKPTGTDCKARDSVPEPPFPEPQFSLNKSQLPSSDPKPSAGELKSPNKECQTGRCDPKPPTNARAAVPPSPLTAMNREDLARVIAGDEGAISTEGTKQVDTHGTSADCLALSTISTTGDLLPTASPLPSSNAISSDLSLPTTSSTLFPSATPENLPLLPPAATVMRESGTQGELDEAKVYGVGSRGSQEEGEEEIEEVFKVADAQCDGRALVRPTPKTIPNPISSSVSRSQKQVNRGASEVIAEGDESSSSSLVMKSDVKAVGSDAGNGTVSEIEATPRDCHNNHDGSPGHMEEGNEGRLIPVSRDGPPCDILTTSSGPACKATAAWDESESGTAAACPTPAGRPHANGNCGCGGGKPCPQCAAGECRSIATALGNVSGTGQELQPQETGFTHSERDEGGGGEHEGGGDWKRNEGKAVDKDVLDTKNMVNIDGRVSSQNEMPKTQELSPKGHSSEEFAFPGQGDTTLDSLIDKVNGLPNGETAYITGEVPASGLEMCVPTEDQIKRDAGVGASVGGGETVSSANAITTSPDKKFPVVEDEPKPPTCPVRKKRKNSLRTATRSSTGPAVVPSCISGLPEGPSPNSGVTPREGPPPSNTYSIPGNPITSSSSSCLTLLSEGPASPPTTPLSEDSASHSNDAPTFEVPLTSSSPSSFDPTLEAPITPPYENMSSLPNYPIFGDSMSSSNEFSIPKGLETSSSSGTLSESGKSASTTLNSEDSPSISSVITTEGRMSPPPTPVYKGLMTSSSSYASFTTSFPEIPESTSALLIRGDPMSPSSAPFPENPKASSDVSIAGDPPPISTVPTLDETTPSPTMQVSAGKSSSLLQSPDNENKGEVVTPQECDLTCKNEFKEKGNEELKDKANTLRNGKVNGSRDPEIEKLNQRMKELREGIRLSQEKVKGNRINEDGFGLFGKSEDRYNVSKIMGPKEYPLYLKPKVPARTKRRTSLPGGGVGLQKMEEAIIRNEKDPQYWKRAEISSSLRVENKKSLSASLNQINENKNSSSLAPQNGNDRSSTTSLTFAKPEVSAMLKYENSVPHQPDKVSVILLEESAESKNKLSGRGSKNTPHTKRKYRISASDTGSISEEKIKPKKTNITKSSSFSLPRTLIKKIRSQEAKSIPPCVPNPFRKKQQKYEARQEEEASAAAADEEKIRPRFQFHRQYSSESFATIFANVPSDLGKEPQGNDGSRKSTEMSISSWAAAGSERPGSSVSLEISDAVQETTSKVSVPTLNRENELLCTEASANSKEPNAHESQSKSNPSLPPDSVSPKVPPRLKKNKSMSRKQNEDAKAEATLRPSVGVLETTEPPPLPPPSSLPSSPPPSSSFSSPASPKSPQTNDTSSRTSTLDSRSSSCDTRTLELFAPLGMEKMKYRITPYPPKRRRGSKADGEDVLFVSEANTVEEEGSDSSENVSEKGKTTSYVGEEVFEKIPTVDGQKLDEDEHLENYRKLRSTGHLANELSFKKVQQLGNDQKSVKLGLLERLKVEIEAEDSDDNRSEVVDVLTPEEKQYAMDHKESFRLILQTWAERQGMPQPWTPTRSLKTKYSGKNLFPHEPWGGEESGEAPSSPVPSSSGSSQPFFDVHEGESLAAQAFEFWKATHADTPSPGPPVEDHSCDKDDLSPRSGGVGEEERIQKDRCVEIYPETVRQRQRNNNMSSNNKVDIKNWTSSSNKGDTNSPSKVKKFLPSVKALRNQFETGKTTPLGNGTPPNSTSTSAPTLSRKSSSSTSSLASSTLEKTSSTNSLASTENGSTENLLNADIRDFAENGRTVIMDPDEPVEPIFNQFKSVDEELKELMSKPPSTTGWNPLPLLKRLYYVPEAPKMKSEGTTYINIEGYLEKLPSGRKKATFWNAWKRRYFIAKDGILYYYQNNQTEKPSMKLPLMGGKVECMEPNMVGVDDGAEKDDLCGSMIGVDDGKGHYVVVRCSSRQEAERWRRALETHTVEDFSSQYVQPWPVPTNPALLRDTLVVDLGSCSVRAGVLASNPTLPQLFFPCVVATQRDTRRQTWGLDALDPDVRSSASLSFPIRPSHKITKYSVDLSAVSSLLQKTFADLKVDPKNYNLQLSVPRILNPNTQVELLKLLFDKFGCRSVNLTHQSILSLYAYNATSGIVVDLGERMDIVPVIDGYIVDGGVSRVPYGGYRILDHLRQFLYMRNVSLVTEVEGYILRYVLEKLCYCAQHYNTEKARCTNNPDNFEKSVSLSEFFQGRDCPYETISLDFGRFQSTEGVFNPDAWGLDHPGLHKLVHKAIQECSMDIRKEMSRSIFLVGGASQLPGLADRLTTELDNLTPPAIRPKVHCSPHRYHAAYLGACVLADSAAFQQSRITREEWNKYGNASIRKWSL